MPRQRLAAIVALVVGAATFGLAIGVAVGEFPRGLVVLAEAKPATGEPGPRGALAWRSRAAVTSKSTDRDDAGPVLTVDDRLTMDERTARHMARRRHLQQGDRLGRPIIEHLERVVATLPAE